MSQHMDALARANEVRLKRSEIKRKVAEGELTVAEVLADPPAEVETMSISELLRAQHRWGNERTRKLCRALVISELRKVGSLTGREKDRISGMLTYGGDASELVWAA